MVINCWKNYKISETLQKYNSETVANKYDKEIPKRGYKSPGEREKIISELKLTLFRMNFFRTAHWLGKKVG